LYELGQKRLIAITRSVPEFNYVAHHLNLTTPRLELFAWNGHKSVSLAGYLPANRFLDAQETIFIREFKNPFVRYCDVCKTLE
jgi:thioredoxin-related protein